jgi:hypothetical protein
MVSLEVSLLLLEVSLLLENMGKSGTWLSNIDMDTNRRACPQGSPTSPSMTSRITIQDDRSRRFTLLVASY